MILTCSFPIPPILGGSFPPGGRLVFSCAGGSTDGFGTGLLADSGATGFLLVVGGATGFHPAGLDGGDVDNRSEINKS